MIKAAIFDMDGLLINSEPFWVEAEYQVFTSIGLPLTREMCAETTGIPIDEVVKIRHRQYNWDLVMHPVSDIANRILEIVIEQVKTKGEPMPGVPDIIERFLNNGYRAALATSSPSTLIEATLLRLGIDGLFEVVQSAEHLAHGKPHPQVFLECAKKLHLLPEECVVFEDSKNGVIAAGAAQMMCIAVPEHGKLDADDFKDAAARLPSLTQFDFDLLPH